MALTTSLSKRDYIYDAIIGEAPLLTSPDLLTTLGFDGMAKLPDLTSTRLPAAEAALVGMAFDYLQRRLITGEWRREPRWQPKHLNRLKLLPDLYPWATEQAGMEAAALTLAFLDQMRRVGVSKVVRSPAHKHIFKATNIDAYSLLLPSNLIETLQELQSLNAHIIDEYSSRPVRIGGPHLFGSHLAHGADPDAIYGSSLVELKTHAKLSAPNLTSGLTQALGYALLDTLDEYGLDCIELWEAKQAQVLRVPLTALTPDPAAARRSLGLKLRWTLHARDGEHAEDLLARGAARLAQVDENRV